MKDPSIRQDRQAWHLLELLRLSLEADDDEGFDSALAALVIHRQEPALPAAPSASL
jgi:hypothetical protein